MIKDPYAVYLAFALGGPSIGIDNRAHLLIAANLGKKHSSSQAITTSPISLMSRQELMAKIGKLNASPQKVKAPVTPVVQEGPGTFGGSRAEQLDPSRFDRQTVAYNQSDLGPRTLPSPRDPSEVIQRAVADWPWAGGAFPEEECYTQLRDQLSMHPAWWGILKGAVRKRTIAHNATLEETLPGGDRMAMLDLATAVMDAETPQDRGRDPNDRWDKTTPLDEVAAIRR